MVTEVPLASRVTEVAAALRGSLTTEEPALPASATW
jgi:hypothetical protein